MPATERDIAAAARILGVDVEVVAMATSAQRGAPVTPRSVNGAATPDGPWYIASASTAMSWQVVKRPDTKNGGYYLFCECPSWAPWNIAYGAANCKHCEVVRRNGWDGTPR